MIVVGGGFAGVGCAKELGKHGVAVTLLDRHNYHQFQPLLYQVASGELAIGDIARPLRGIFTKDESVEVKMVEVVGIDPDSGTVVMAGGEKLSGDYLVLASGSIPNFFKTPGADEHAFPLYSATDAEQLRSRLFQVFEDADADPSRIDEGALNIVVIGGGPTGVETAGAVADLVNDVMPKRYHDLAVNRARIYLVDHGQVVLSAFSDKAHKYAAERLQHLGVTLMLGIGVTEVANDRVALSDGNEILTRTVVWAGGIKADELAGFDKLDRGRGGRLTAQPDLTVDGHPNVYAIGDLANIPDQDGDDLPQLGSVALQAGRWAAQNIMADIHGRNAQAVPLPRQRDHGHDRSRRGRRRDGRAPSRAPWARGLRGLAGSARLAHERGAQPHRRIRRVGMGLPRIEPGYRDHQSRRPGHRLGRRRPRPTRRHVMSLDGKIAIVTGGNSGIGKAVVLALAKEGANIVIDYVANPEATEALEQQIVALGGKAIGVKADVSKVADLQMLVDSAVKAFGRLDVMVNNAGVETRTSVLDTTEAQYDKVLDINLKSAFFGTQIAAKQMIAQGGGGRIINITSVHEDWPMPNNTAYCLSKGGMRMLTRTAGVELAPQGVLVVGVGPGAVDYSHQRRDRRPIPAR